MTALALKNEKSGAAPTVNRAPSSVNDLRNTWTLHPIRRPQIMETAKQISVFLENKPGRLAGVLSALAQEKVNVIALTVMDSHEHNVLRMVTEDFDKTRQALKSHGTPFAESEVLMVEVRHQAGALAHVCEVLAAEHINIDYAYCSAGGRNGKTWGIFKLSNADKAIRILGGPANHALRRRMGRRPIHTRQTGGAGR
jgi:hypothetical protein